MNVTPINPREYPLRPIPAVAGLVFSDSETVLLIQRGNPPAKGKWSLPGGVVDLGEKPEEALKREINEECGIQIIIESILTVVSRIIRDHLGKIQYHYIITDYLCQYNGGDLSPGSDAENACWIHKRRLDSLDLSEGLFEVIQKGLAQKSNTAQEVY